MYMFGLSLVAERHTISRLGVDWFERSEPEAYPNSGRVGSSLLSLSGGLCLAVATSFLFVVSQYYYHTQLY